MGWLYRLCMWPLLVFLSVLVVGPQFVEFFVTIRLWVLLAVIITGILAVWAWCERRNTRRRGHVRHSEAVGLALANRHEEARHAFTEALMLYKQASHFIGQANTLNGLGDVEWQLQRYDAARDFYTQALRVYTQLNNRFGQAKALRSLGNVAREENNAEHAHDFYTQALRLYTQLGVRLGQADLLLNLGQLSIVANPEAANQHLSRAAELYRDLGQQEQARAAAKAAQELD